MDKRQDAALRPREKARRFGIRQLTDRELVQLLVSSGSGKHKINAISKKVLVAIKSLNADLTYDKLQTIPGLGPARISQLLATFELASRYPLLRRTIKLSTFENAIEYIIEHQSNRRHMVMTLDGAGYLINKREHSYQLSDELVELQKQIVSDVIGDNAKSVLIVLRDHHRTLAPFMHGLIMVRDLSKVGSFLGFSVTDVIMEQNGDYRSVLASQKRERFGR